MKTTGIRLVFKQDGKKIAIFLSPDEWREFFLKPMASKKNFPFKSEEEEVPYLWGV